MSNLTDFDSFFNAKPVVQEQQPTQLTEFRPNPKKGQNGVFEAVVRFLPNPKDPANKSIITKYCAYLTHPVSQVKMSIDCPSTIGQQDPIQNTFFALRNAANPVLQENSKQFSRKQQCRHAGQTPRRGHFRRNKTKAPHGTHKGTQS